MNVKYVLLAAGHFCVSGPMIDTFGEKFVNYNKSCKHTRLCCVRSQVLNHTFTLWTVGHGLHTFTSMPSLTQPSNRHGMVNEYQLSG